MARGTTLNILVEQLRLELQQAQSPALGQNARPAHIHALKTTQERLYDDWNWPHLRITRDVDMVAGSRYYNFPDDINPERAIKCQVKYNGVWQGGDLSYGIDATHYNISDSDEDARMDPVARWQLYEGDMFEAHPMPATDGVCSLRFTGIKNLSPLIANADTADLDDTLIVLYAAVKLLGEKAGKLKLQEAQTHYAKIKSNLQKRRWFIMGGGLIRAREKTIIVRHATATPEA